MGGVYREDSEAFRLARMMSVLSIQRPHTTCIFSDMACAALGPRHRILHTPAGKPIASIWCHRRKVGVKVRSPRVLQRSELLGRCFGREVACEIASKAVAYQHISACWLFLADDRQSLLQARPRLITDKPRLAPCGVNQTI